jgi:ribosomal protein L27
MKIVMTLLLGLTFQATLASAATYQLKSNGESFSVGQNSSGQDVSLFAIEEGMICFKGNPNAAEAAVSAKVKVKGQVLGNDMIRFLWSDTTCVSGHGMYDGYECDKEIKANKVGFIMSCSLAIYGRDGN